LDCAKASREQKQAVAACSPDELERLLAFGFVALGESLFSNGLTMGKGFEHLAGDRSGR